MKTTRIAIKGTDHLAGDVTIDGHTVVLVEQGQHDLGAKYADLHLSNGKCKTAWEGFTYQVER